MFPTTLPNTSPVNENATVNTTMGGGHRQSHKRISGIIALLLVSIALIFVACFGLISRPAYTETTSPEYSVEHIHDRIAQKLPAGSSIVVSDATVSKNEEPDNPHALALMDTGYRVRTRTLVVDADKVSPEDTIEDVYSGSDEEIISRLLYQSESISTVYDFGDTDSYLAYIDISGDNGKTSHPQDAVFAYDTTQGEMIESVSYDKETGLAYIPKGLFDEPRMTELAENQHELQAQTLVRYDLSDAASAYNQDKQADSTGSEPGFGETSASNAIPVEIRTDAGSASKMAQVPLLGNQFAIQLVDEDDAELVKQKSISVNLNDEALVLTGAKDAYSEGSNIPSFSYDDETGVVNFYNVSPASVLNATINVEAFASPSMATYASIAYAGEITTPTEAAYTIGHYGQANASGATSSNYDAVTKTIRRWGPGQSVQQFSDVTINDISDGSCAYIISIGRCPQALGASWTANGDTKWRADCVHCYYPNGTANPPSGGYYKVLAADWNAQTVTLAFFITCNSSGQEGAIVLTFYAPRNGVFEITKKANANPALGAMWSSNVGNAIFGVYNSETAAKAGGSAGLVKKLTTNSRGIATGSFDDGTYWVRELSAPWPYIVSDQIVTFTAKPKSKDYATFYNDSVPPIQIRKKILPSADSYIENELVSGSKKIADIKTTVASNGKDITTTITAKEDISNIVVKNSATTVLTNPATDDKRFDKKTSTIQALAQGESITLTQSVKTGQGWSNTESLATICSISTGATRTDMALKLHHMSLEGTRYGVYSDAACTKKLGEAVLDSSGVGYYGKKPGEWLSAYTTYYVREVAGVNGYTVSSDIYPVTTARNSQVTVSVADSFSTLILTKESGAGKTLTDKLPQFSLKGAKYGVFSDKDTAELHDESKVIKTLDGRPAIITTDKFGKATEVALGAGTYYVAELPSIVTRPWVYGQNNDDFDEPADIEASVKNHDYNSKSNGKFLLDDTVYTVNMKAGGTTFQTSNENIPVRIQLQKQSTRADLAQLPQFSLEGAVFGVYTSEAAAKAVETGNYKQQGYNVSYVGAVAILYGNKTGLTTVSEDLPLQDYYIKELRAPKNYKLLGTSHWLLGSSKTTNDIIHVTANDFLASGKYIDGVLTNTTLVKVNEPADVTVQVQKQASEVPDGMKTPGNAMSLAGARFAVYKTYEDARADVNRLWFNTDDNPTGEKTDLLTSTDDGWSNKAIELPAEACYWTREIEPPHIIDADPVKNAQNITESMYILDSEPVKATFDKEDDITLIAYKDNKVKPISITIGKYAMSMDNEGRNLHVGEKDANGNPYNDAYTDAAFEGAIFGLFETREAAENVKVTDDITDVSVEKAAWDAGAIAVMTSDANGVCGTIDNLKWKADGYYVRELKAPTSGCYKRNTSILQVGCDRNTKDSEHIWVEIDEGNVYKHFEVDEIPNYYYVKIEKTSSDSSVLSDTKAYDLEGIHFGIYKTREEAEAATAEEPGSPLYNLFTKKVEHDDGSIHYEAISGLTGPGVFWAKELIADDDLPNGFQKLSAPIRVEAKLGGIPKYDATPIVPENAAPIPDKTTGQLQYKTAKDIDDEMNIIQEASPSSLMLLQRNTFAGLTGAVTYAISSIQGTNSGSHSGDNGAFPIYSGGNSLTFRHGDLVNYSGLQVWASCNGYTGYLSRIKAVPPWPSGNGVSQYNFETSFNCGLSNNDRTLRNLVIQLSYQGWHDEGKTSFYPQILLSYNANGGTWKTPSVTSQTKNIGFSVTMLGTDNVSRTGYTFAGWTANAANAAKAPTSQVTHYNGGQTVGPMDWNATSMTFWSNGADRWTHLSRGWHNTGVYTNPVGSSTVTLYATWTPKTYDVSFDANGGANASSKRVATYDAAMPTASIPTRTGYTFQGYWDTAAAVGGTQYYKADGTSARTWNKAANTTLYARWKANTYTVQYLSTDPNTSLAPGVAGAGDNVSCTYDKAFTSAGVMFYKFGYAQKGWTYTPNGKTIDVALSDNVKNLSSTPNATVELYPVWETNEYFVKFNDGLSTQWGPSPSVESGTNPDTNTPWSLGYQQKLWYDDYATDGIFSEALTANRYSHPYFTFKYWTDVNGTKYNDKQEVQNLTEPNNVYELTGVWYPAFDYGVDCEPNIIVNQPIGGLTVQKVVKSDNTAPAALTDLSGIEFEIFADENCQDSVTMSETDEKGIACFDGLEANTTYYIKEKSIPEHLSSIMNISDEIKQVRTGSETSYEFENEYKELTLNIIKTPSQNAIDSVNKNILNAIPPDGVRFALYTTEDDARNDVNRVQFYDENAHLTTIATLTKIVDEDGVKCTTTTITGLPNQDLWLRELTAPDHGKHEYILNENPILVSADQDEISNGKGNMLLTVPNDIAIQTAATAAKEISEADLERIPEALRDDAQVLTNGITYALYMNRDDALARNDDYALTFDMSNGTSTLSNLPYGTYYLIEHSLPQAAIEAGITRSDRIITLEITENGQSAADMLDTMITKRMHIKKIDADTSEPITGVIFDIYTDDPENGGEWLCSTTQTDTQGIAVTDSDLIPGRSYFVVERYDSLPPEYSGQGVGTDNTWSGWIELTLADDIDTAHTIENTKNNETGSIEVKKASNTGASLAGAIFTIYDSTGAEYATMTTNEEGIAHLDDVPVGSYTVQETTPLDNHALTSDDSQAQVFEGIVYPNDCWHVKDGEAVVNYQGYVRVHKESAAPELTDELRDVYSLAGAVFSLYPMEDGNPLATPLSVTMVTDENGDSNVVAVPFGSYKVVETTEPINFSTPTEMREFYVNVTLDNATIDTAYVVESKDSPSMEPLANLTVEKRSSETLAASDGSPQGATSMAGTKFMIEYATEQAIDYESALASEKTRHWVIATDIDGRAKFDEESIITEESDEVYRDSNGAVALPVGTIVIREIVPPIGYTLGDAPTIAYRFNGESGKFEELTPDTDELTEIDGEPVFTAANQIYRADISFHKVDAYDENKIMSNVPFALTLLDENGNPIERHLIYTDENGNYSSKNGSIDNVNENDKWIPGDVINGTVNSDFTPVDSRVWFSGSRVETIPSADKGALIYGDYELREYYRDDTTHYQSLEPIYFSVRGDNDESWIEINGQRVTDGNLTEGIGNVENHSIHITGTEFLDTVTNTHSMESSNLLATETIDYADATLGEKYIFETYAFDVDTGDAITKDFIDVDGEEVTVQAGGAYTLITEETSGNVSIDVSFEGYDVSNRTIGLVTKVYHNGYLSDKHNINLDDTRESISFAQIGTEARDANTNQHIGLADKHIELIDTVRYENLVIGEQYTVRGTLMDKATGKALLDANGNIVTGETAFTASTRAGDVEVLFSFDASENVEFTAVVFEKLYQADALIASHEDIEDESQSVTYPSVSTIAHDGETNSFQGNAGESDVVTIVDEIKYTNLIAGKEYECHGILYTLDENGNKTPIEGAETVSSFVPSAEDGSTMVIFTASADAVYGHRVLVGEEIRSEGQVIARHDDASFKDQVVSYPAIETDAFAFESGLHVGNGEDSRVIVDTIHARGLKPGETYRIDGSIVALSRDGQSAATPITSSDTVIAESDVQDFKLSFELPKDFPTENAVVFEKISSADGFHLLAAHEDADDERQTIHYPKIGTLAWHPSETNVGSNIDNKINDTVFYENLVTGYDYELLGMLVDKETGEFIDNQEGTAPVMSSVQFSPTSSEGSVDVPFDLNGIDVRGKTLVVFEQLFVKTGDYENAQGKSLIATHCDIDADKQTMFYPHLRTTARDVMTETHLGSSLSENAIADAIEYENLVPGYEYEITGTLMDKESGEPLLVDGNPVTAGSKFVPSDRNGIVEVSFGTLPFEATAGKTIVVFEKLSLAGYEMASHEDIEDEAQSVFYPSIHTTATDLLTGLHEGNVSSYEDEKSVSVIDKVEYANIEPGRSYKVIGSLIDKSSGETVSSGEATFTPESSAGSVDVVFELPVDVAARDTFVAFEKLFDDGEREIAHHEDIEDEAQTVSYPVIRTQAEDAKTKSSAGSIDGIDIVDTVSYEGLLPGHEYTVYGVFVDKDSNKVIEGANGDVLEASTTFTAAENGVGEVEVEFSFDIPAGMTLPGKTLVAFERLVEAGDADRSNVIASHEDIDDEAQTIHYPVITRTLARADNDSKWLDYSNKALMSDTITYENIVPGIEYTAVGTLMSKQTEDVVVAAGKAAEEEMSFIPSDTSGEIEVVFEMDTTMDEISDTVVFERIRVNGALVAEHTDYNSEDQSIYGIADELIETNETPLGNFEEILRTDDNIWRLLALAGCLVLSIAGIMFIRMRRTY